ncbi:ABC transporter substrate-binding protein [Celeribacter neptunius]|uniref:Iron(III) transport system substrate-binding protein n=1 Tax=Celeribacter neptunius TaxID=588602 RepID=A0A1I3UBH3_9RHOB|nr:ABC transporter substrate-binding protein [Celeribacter neptunius]SFJ80262.1 iron(III) transport system substrate-binding protein [Celeribacter neptunius]
MSRGFRVLRQAMGVAACLFGSAALAQETAATFYAGEAAPHAALLIRSTTDLAIFAPLLDAFATANPTIELQYEQWGSNALYADSRKACDGQGGSADVVISSGVHQMVDLVNRACASPYRSELTAQLPRQRRWRDELWGISREAAVIIYNKDLVPAGEVPRTRFALLDLMRRSTDQYLGKIATYDIETSGLGFLFAFMDSQQATTFGGLMEAFARAGAVATCCSAEIIASVEQGEYKIAYNVLGSYVNSGVKQNIGVIFPEDYTMFLSRGLMIPKGSENKVLAGAFLDFLLSAEGRGLLTSVDLIQESDRDVNAQSDSSERYIPIDPTLLVAMDRHRRAQFIAKWRDSFGAQGGSE